MTKKTVEETLEHSRDCYDLHELIADKIPNVHERLSFLNFMTGWEIAHAAKNKEEFNEAVGNFALNLSKVWDVVAEAEELTKRVQGETEH